VATVGIVLLPLLCCGLPLLITAGTLGAIASVLGSPWVIAVAIVLVLGVVLWRHRRRAATTTRTDHCCPPRTDLPDSPTAH
jgi:uncharacterized iron-regulated membrane protein